MLGIGVVDRDHREGEHALLLHGAKPDHTGRRLFGTADDVGQQLAPIAVELRDQVSAVVHRDLGPGREHGVEVPVVPRVVLALVSEDRNAVLLDQRRRRVVLGGERIGRAEHDLSAARLEREHQHRGFRRHVEAGAETDALERLFLGEALTHLTQDRHRLFRPLDPEAPGRGLRQVLDVVLSHEGGRPFVLRRCARGSSRGEGVGGSRRGSLPGHILASSRRSLTRFVCSQLNSGSVRPK